MECIIAFTIYCKLDTSLSVCNGVDLLLNINNLTVPLKAEETAQVCSVNYIYYYSALASIIEMKMFKLRFMKAEAEFLHEIQTKVLQSFPPSYSQPPLQLCLEIYISLNSRNLLKFLEFRYCTL